MAFPWSFIPISTLIGSLEFGSTSPPVPKHPVSHTPLKSCALNFAGLWQSRFTMLYFNDTIFMFSAAFSAVLYSFESSFIIYIGDGWGRGWGIPNNIQIIAWLYTDTRNKLPNSYQLAWCMRFFLLTLRTKFIQTVSHLCQYDINTH